MPPEVDLIAKLVGGGGVLTLAVLMWFDLRASRREQREDRLDIIQLVGQQNAILNRLDERTAHLAGELTPVDAPARRRTPPAGVPAGEYSYTRGRRGRTHGED